MGQHLIYSSGFGVITQFFVLNTFTVEPFPTLKTCHAHVSSSIFQQQARGMHFFVMRASAVVNSDGHMEVLHPTSDWFVVMRPPPQPTPTPPCFSGCIMEIGSCPLYPLLPSSVLCLLPSTSAVPPPLYTSSPPVSLALCCKDACAGPLTGLLPVDSPARSR